MFKLLCLLIVVTISQALDQTIYGFSPTAPYTTLSVTTTTTSNKLYKLIFTHKASSDIVSGAGPVTVCCVTAVSDSTKASLKDKCFVYQVWCSTGTCSSQTNYQSELKPATTTGTAITVGTEVSRVSVAYATPATYTSTYEVSSAEAAAAGLPDTLTPKYRVDITCYTDAKTSGFTSAQSVTTKPTTNAKSFAIGSGAASKLVPAALISLFSALYTFL